jgi:hypothetical protein
MAASLSLTEAQAELISSLPQDDIPAKLRCAICSKLAVNAFRLPCCEQAICESCQSALPASCPVCEHSPLSADDCKPHKALRTTIKVFLRTEEKKRESNRPKDVATTPITPVDPSPISATAPATFERLPVGEGVGTAQEQQAPVAEQGAEEGAPAGDQESGEPGAEEVQQKTTENTSDDTVGHHSSTQRAAFVNNHQEQALHNAEEGEGDAATSTDLVPAQQGTELVEGDDAEAAQEGDENGDVNKPDPDGSGVAQAEGMSGAFPPAGFTPGFDQMPMMMAMQNGFGNFPMMG